MKEDYQKPELTKIDNIKELTRSVPDCGCSLPPTG